MSDVAAHGTRVVCSQHERAASAARRNGDKAEWRAVDQVVSALALALPGLLVRVAPISFIDPGFGDEYNFLGSPSISTTLTAGRPHATAERRDQASLYIFAAGDHEFMIEVDT